MLGVVVSQSVSQSIYRSSVEFFPSVPRPARTSPVSPNYALRRAGAVVVALVAMVLLVGTIVLLAGPGGRPASAFQAEPALSSAARVHVARAGDSLWSIARANRGDVSIDRYVDALIDLNGGTAIAVGQAVRLP